VARETTCAGFCRRDAASRAATEDRLGLKEDAGTEEQYRCLEEEDGDCDEGGGSISF
jgi:hypothetical protein